MKVLFITSGLLVALVAFPLLTLVNFTQGIEEKTVSQRQDPELPVRLLIPAINVNARIQDVGVALNGEMEVPNNAIDVGWFKIGSRPGEVGSAVVAGHIDGESGEVGVFANLYKLKEGDLLYIEDDKGTSITFVVRKKLIFDPGYADEVFSRNDGAHLNLITCDGLWDGVKKSYSKRLVVFSA